MYEYKYIYIYIYIYIYTHTHTHTHTAGAHTTGEVVPGNLLKIARNTNLINLYNLAFIVFSTTVLVNLLVALMGSTFTRHSQLGRQMCVPCVCVSCVCVCTMCVCAMCVCATCVCATCVCVCHMCVCVCAMCVCATSVCASQLGQERCIASVLAPLVANPNVKRLASPNVKRCLALLLPRLMSSVLDCLALCLSLPVMRLGLPDVMSCVAW